MDFIRFTGEWFVYFALLGLGGAVLIALTVGLFSAIGMDVTWFVQEWMLPCGIARRGRDRRLAGRGQAERHREHRARCSRGSSRRCSRCCCSRSIVAGIVAGQPRRVGPRPAHPVRRRRSSSCSRCCSTRCRRASPPAPPGVVRPAPAADGGRRARHRRAPAHRDDRADRNVRRERQQARLARAQPHPAGEPRGRRVAAVRVRARAGRVRPARAVADLLRAGVSGHGPSSWSSSSRRCSGSRRPPDGPRGSRMRDSRGRLEGDRSRGEEWTPRSRRPGRSPTSVPTSPC